MRYSERRTHLDEAPARLHDAIELLRFSEPYPSIIYYEQCVHRDAGRLRQFIERNSEQPPIVNLLVMKTLRKRNHQANGLLWSYPNLNPPPSCKQINFYIDRGLPRIASASLTNAPCTER